MSSKGLSEDIFSLMICHEVGHLLGGPPFILRRGEAKQRRDLESSEGQSDYFATHVCLKKLWGKKSEINNTIAKHTPSETLEICKQSYSSFESLNLCRRILSVSMAFLQYEEVVFFEDDPAPPVRESSGLSWQYDKVLFEQSPDNQIQGHPSAACRLSTLIRGALCKKTYPSWEIPGFSSGSKYSEAFCSQKKLDESFAARPNCWFIET